MILPGSKVGWINLALVILLVAVGGTYHRELYWAWEQIDDYRQGYIDSPLERELYLEGRYLLYQERQPDAATALLEESIRIDPNSEAVFLLAESFRVRGEFSQAARFDNGCRRGRLGARHDKQTNEERRCQA